ncbi:MAG: 50S ribosomal protein L9 [Lachnospiraceae bacterium]|jgi:ribosomal protein L9|nr:50S ribosomal protein L9 [Lachnospiraceae bacterium]
MKVILLEDVKSLGKKGDIVNVSDGYARNMLLPKKLGVEANNKNMNDLKLQNQHAQKVAQENLDKAKALAEEISDKQVTVTLKTGEGGKTFGSVSAKEISAAAKAQLELELDKKKMQLPDGGLKTLGVHEIKIKFHPKVTGTLKVKVAEE